ncbi:branched-chain amino acid ABC transporter permease [Rhizocola hellebori]|uniref:Branched-chain amino acid ABC transporter permease n=1 Tax=Rhizocola hellebori TaxID=1392758 RepID=A0A8J3VL56_9ACTN|nr:branched-chain amino acid ABC transporter permease [Rhizocola hellebori]GIH10510.1 branched-chain amino acid ABC transporter permease [Rhizocola hellebori]
MNALTRWWPVGAFLLLIAIPYNALTNAPGTLQLLALCLVFGGLAAGYDLLFGRTGLLSFGHALYFAIGVYVTAILVTEVGLPLAMLFALLAGTTVAAALGAIALRVKGIAFSMVTLAFAQVGAILVARNPGGLTGGEEGLPLSSGLPSFLIGVANTVNLYWLAVAYLTLVVVVLHRVAQSPTGRVFAGIRDDALRVDVLGLNPYRYKLVAFTLAGALAALGGAVYVLVVGGASTHVASSDLTLTLLIMVVLGGPGTRFGPVIGGILFTFLDHRLSQLGVTFDLPGPLAEPLFILGTLFILAVYFFPGGLATLGRRVTSRRTALSRSAP